MARGCGAALTPLHYFHRTLFSRSAAAAEPLAHYHPHLNVSPLCAKICKLSQGCCIMSGYVLNCGPSFCQSIFEINLDPGNNALITLQL